MSQSGHKTDGKEYPQKQLAGYTHMEKYQRTVKHLCVNCVGNMFRLHSMAIHTILCIIWLKRIKTVQKEPTATVTTIAILLVNMSFRLR